MLRAKLEYNGKVMFFPCDHDPQVYVNDPRRGFEDGSEVTTQDVVELLAFCGRNKTSVHFIDDNGNEILFDGNGDPIIKVEDGKIVSAAHDCICDKTFPMHGGLRSGGKETYDKFKAEVERSGIFTEGRKIRKLVGKEIEYTCKTCGNVWTLSDGSYPGSFLWGVKSRLNGRG